MSSRISDIGSPNTPGSVSRPTSRLEQHQRLLLGSPSLAPVPSINVSKVAKNLFEDSSDNASTGPALSTRSQRPLVDKELDELEQDLLFVAPDIDPSNYDVDTEFDGDYVDFLTTLYKSANTTVPFQFKSTHIRVKWCHFVAGSSAPPEAGDDDVNDTDFNVLAAASEPVDSSDDESEEYRYDRVTKISSEKTSCDVSLKGT